MDLFMQLEYDRLLAEILNMNVFYHRQFSTSPTITELSKMIGVSEENILESMEFGHPSSQYVC